MSQRVRKMRLRRTGTVPPDVRVLHYDELSDRTQDAIFEIADRPRTAPETPDLDDGDVVKFTDYYQVRAR